MQHLQKVEAAAAIAKIEFPHFLFRKCDGDLDVNKAEFKEATFLGGFFLFTTFEMQGIEKYTHDVSRDTIVQHIRNLHGTFNPADIKDFVDEDGFFDDIDRDPEHRVCSDTRLTILFSPFDLFLLFCFFY